MKMLIKRLAKSEDGATSIEYALMCVILGISVISFVSDLPVALSGLLNSATDNLK